MSHQGNLFLGYSLVLLVKPLEDEARPGYTLDYRTTEEAITAHAVLHLRARFCKNHEDPLTTDSAVARFVAFQPLKHVGELTIDRCSSNPKIYVCIDTNAVGSRGSIRLDAFRDLVRTYCPTAHVEESRIKCPDSDKVEQLTKELADGKTSGPGSDDDGGIYHLGSRICTAFVEYFTPWKKKDGDGHESEKSDDGKVEHDLALWPVPFEQIVNETDRMQRKWSVFPKVMDVRDAIDLVFGCLDGAMNYFPPVPEELLHLFEGKETTSEVWVRYKFPFGVWFRGSARICYGLQPSIFRYAKPIGIHTGCRKRLGEQSVMFDECSMVHHFREYLPEHLPRYGPMFDWLCLMQEHGAPTRLLDWTENILYALYFAVQDRGVDCDGVVWVLNPGRLNEITRVSATRRYMCFPHSSDVHLRTAMALSHTWPEMRRILLKLGLYEQTVEAAADEVRKEMEALMLDRPAPSVHLEDGHLSLQEKLRYPVAVFPGRGNKRLAAQLGTFTIYGGKEYDEKIEKNFTPYPFLKPASLVELNDDVVAGRVAGKRFLDAWVIPSGCKRKIREQLKRLGVHPASIFPDLDNQSQYIKREWMIGTGTERS
jgi:hypothetical protein